MWVDVDICVGWYRASLEASLCSCTVSSVESGAGTGCTVSMSEPKDDSNVTSSPTSRRRHRTVENRRSMGHVVWLGADADPVVRDAHQDTAR